MEINQKKIFDDFRKILKEKAIKKTTEIKFYQIFSCLLKKNKNFRIHKNQNFINE